jgi:hypothetical protein
MGVDGVFRRFGERPSSGTGGPVRGARHAPTRRAACAGESPSRHAEHCRIDSADSQSSSCSAQGRPGGRRRRGERATGPPEEGRRFDRPPLPCSRGVSGLSSLERSDPRGREVPAHPGTARGGADVGRGQGHGRHGAGRSPQGDRGGERTARTTGPARTPSTFRSRDLAPPRRATREARASRGEGSIAAP